MTMTPAKEKRVRKVLRETADCLNAIICEIDDRGIADSDPELAALVDEARMHAFDCKRAARN